MPNHSENPQLLREAIQNKNEKQIITLLKQGIQPEDPSQQVEVIDHETNMPINKSFIKMLLTENEMQIANLNAAEQLYRLGCPLPRLNRKKKDFSTLKEYLIHLIYNPYDLFIELHAHPELINQQDEGGKTLLHHAATICLVKDKSAAELVLYQLFNAPNVDFAIKDKEGNTALHIVGNYLHDQPTSRYVYPEYLKAAQLHGYDFSLLNNKGRAIIHLAAINTYINLKTGLHENNVFRFLKIVDNPHLDILSQTGSTAYYYAIEHDRPDEAKALLAAGASSTLYGNPERDPTKMLTEKLKGLKNATTSEEATLYKAYKEIENYINNPFDKIKSLYKKRNIGIGLAAIGLFTLPLAGLGLLLLIPGIIITAINQYKYAKAQASNDEFNILKLIFAIAHDKLDEAKTLSTKVIPIQFDSPFKIIFQTNKSLIHDMLEVINEKIEAAKNQHNNSYKALTSIKNRLFAESYRRQRNIGIGLAIAGLITLPIGVGLFMLIPGLIKAAKNQKNYSYISKNIEQYPRIIVQPDLKFNYKDLIPKLSGVNMSSISPNLQAGFYVQTSSSMNNGNLPSMSDIQSYQTFASNTEHALNANYHQENLYTGSIASLLQSQGMQANRSLEQQPDQEVDEHSSLLANPK